jgi:band 7 protein
MFLFPILPIAIIAIMLILIFITGYVKAPPNMVYIISGLKRRPKFISGKSTIKIPFLQRVDKLSLEMLSVDVKTSKTIPTADYINILVDSVATVKITNTEESIARASENFLNKNSSYINEMIVNVLEGNLREIIGGMPLVDIMNDRKSFAQLVQENAATDMAKMGLEIVSFNIQNIDDAGIGVINNLGIANTVAIQKSAEISRANAEKEIAVAQANANLEANEAQVKSETAIAERQNALAIKKAELRKAENQKEAEAEAAYSIAEEEQRKTKENVTADANAVKAKREIEIRRDILVSERNNEEDAKLYAAQQEAKAIRAVAEANAEAKKLEAEAEAKKVEMIGQAEADALYKKAEAMKQYGEAAILETALNAYVEMSKNIVSPLEKIDSITMYGDGNQAKLVADTTKTLTQLDSGLSDALGIDIKSMIGQFLGTKLGVQSAVKNIDVEETVVSDDNTEVDNMNEE